MKKGWGCRCRYHSFGLTPEDKILLHKQIFELSYYSNGGFNQDIVYRLPVYLRNFYYRTLVSAKDKENEQNEEASNKAKNSSVKK